MSTGSQLAKLEILNDRYNDHSIALPANGKFIATFVERSIFILDTSTLSRTGPVIQENEEIRAIAISADSSYLATGCKDGKLVIRHLNSVLPDLYTPVHVSICISAFIVLAYHSVTKRVILTSLLYAYNRKHL